MYIGRITPCSRLVRTGMILTEEGKKRGERGSDKNERVPQGWQFACGDWDEGP